MIKNNFCPDRLTGLGYETFNLKIRVRFPAGAPIYPNRISYPIPTEIPIRHGVPISKAQKVPSRFEVLLHVCGVNQIWMKHIGFFRGVVQLA